MSLKALLILSLMFSVVGSLSAQDDCEMNITENQNLIVWAFIMSDTSENKDSAVVAYLSQVIEYTEHLNDVPFLLFLKTLRSGYNIKLKSFHSVIPDCNYILNKCPEDGEVLMARGYSYMNLGKEPEACVDFKKSIELGTEIEMDEIRTFVQSKCK